jgi:hypothetical protein
MTRTSYITARSWQEQVTLQLYYSCNVTCSCHDLAVMYLVLVMI